MSEKLSRKDYVILFRFINNYGQPESVRLNDVRWFGMAWPGEYSPPGHVCAVMISSEGPGLHFCSASESIEDLELRFCEATINNWNVAAAIRDGDMEP